MYLPIRTYVHMSCLFAPSRGNRWESVMCSANWNSRQAQVILIHLPELQEESAITCACSDLHFTRTSLSHQCWIHLEARVNVPQKRRVIAYSTSPLQLDLGS